jgi:hypothetical protein
MMLDILKSFRNVKKSGSGWTAACPAHDDRQASLSIRHKDGKWLLRCHAGCSIERVTAAARITIADLFDEKKGGGGKTCTPPNNSATVQQSGLTVGRYGEAKRLPVEFLRSCGLTDIHYDGAPAVRIPYFGTSGELLAVRFRVALHGDRFRWKSGDKPQLYGLNRIAEARDAGQVVLVEGESDVHTFWHHRIPALGFPGAHNWREDRDPQHLDGVDKIYVVIEPDKGGETVRKWVAQSAIRHRVLLVTLPVKDASALHLDSEADFRSRWQIACLGAIPWTAHEQEASAEERAEAWNECSDLAQSADILALLDGELTKLGVVGERRAAKLLYLAVTSRLLDRPVSVAVKGPSSGGKSYVTEQVLKLFPSSAYYSLTAMSEKSLAYGTEPIKHRHLVIYEAAGMASDFASYLVRSLLSEGRLRYETVEKTKDGLIPKVIEREGPAGLLVTTTAIRLHPENETRLLSLTVTDTREQTASIFKALANGVAEGVDVARWQALQTWLATGSAAVIIPFANELAALVPPIAVRLRRDFRTVLSLIRAHALLHQATRRKDEAGRVIATLADYAAARALAGDLVAAGVEVAVGPEVRQTVTAVAELMEGGKSEVSLPDLSKKLKLEKSSVSRRVNAAISSGYLKNLEDRKRQASRLVLGEPLPDAQDVLPDEARLMHCCTSVQGEIHPPSPPANTATSPTGTTIRSSMSPTSRGSRNCTAVASALGPAGRRLNERARDFNPRAKGMLRQSRKE